MNKIFEASRDEFRDFLTDAVATYNKRKLDEILTLVESKSFKVKNKKVIDVEILKEFLNVVLLQMGM